MNRAWTWIVGLLVVVTGGAAGCAWRESKVAFNHSGDAEHYNAVATQIEYPDSVPANCSPLSHTPAPTIVGKDGAPVYWDLKLDEAMQQALSNSKVLQDLGGLVLRSPANARTIHEPAIADTDPRFGVEAALAEFDAVFSSSVIAQHNDRALNNVFFGGGTRIFQQNTDVFRTEITKHAATGAQFSFRNNTTYDQNNSPGNLFGSAWDVNYEFEARQPLLQGAGVEYNRIAGPSNTPGVVNGVLVARLNTDISLADFEMGVRDLVSNVENAYWDLYFAYRDLDAKIRARDLALESWRRIQALYASGRRGGEAEKEADAREQYFRFEEDVQNAWAGRLVDGTQTNNGSAGGTLRGNGGVRVAERRLRLLMGLPATDGRLIRPADEPKIAKVVFDWDEVLPESLTRRPELRRQKWLIKRRELELVAAKNFLLPTLDAEALYRFRGFGKDLIDSNRQADQFNNAYENLTSGEFQEWEMGLQLNIPLGMRKGHAAVRNAQLLVARERAVLQDQEEQVTIDLTNAIADVDRAYEVAQTNYNRRLAARQQVQATEAAFESDKAPLFVVLDAQRRLADADSRFYAALVDYALSIKNVHFEKGSLLEYNDIYLAEGPWPSKAYHDAEHLETAKWRPWRMDFLQRPPHPVSDDPYAQHAGPGGAVGAPEELPSQPGTPADGGKPAANGPQLLGPGPSDKTPAPAEGPTTSVPPGHELHTVTPVSAQSPIGPADSTSAATPPARVEVRWGPAPDCGCASGQ